MKELNKINPLEEFDADLPMYEDEEDYSDELMIFNKDKKRTYPAS